MNAPTDRVDIRWIRVEVELPRHPKSIRIGRMLSNPLAWAWVQRVWCYCANYARDGVIPESDFPVVEEFIGYPGPPGSLFDAMRKVGFAEPGDGPLIIHDWMEENGRAIAQTVRETVEKRNKRAAAGAGTAAAAPRNRRGTAAATPDKDPTRTKETETTTTRACARDEGEEEAVAVEERHQGEQGEAGNVESRTFPSPASSAPSPSMPFQAEARIGTADDLDGRSGAFAETALGWVGWWNGRREKLGYARELLNVSEAAQWAHRCIAEVGIERFWAASEAFLVDDWARKKGAPLAMFRRDGCWRPRATAEPLRRARP